MKAWLQKNEKINIWKTEAVRIRDTLRNRKYRIQVAIVAGRTAPGVVAWWGSLYPQFCFSQTDQKPKISFWLAKAIERW